MKASRSEVWLHGLSQADLDWLIAQGVSTAAMVQPSALMIATGFAASDGLFEHADEGERWLAFEEVEDFVFWQPRHGRIATYGNRAFALGEAAIDDPTTYAFDCALHIFASPLDWLCARRDGIVTIDWKRAFDRLRDAPRVTVAESLLGTYKSHMRPPRMPEVYVLRENRQGAT